MNERPPQATPSRVILVLVGLLLFITAFTLLHWHKDWTDPGCQLCHVRHQPSLHSTTAVAYGVPHVFQQNWNCEHSAEELESCIRNTSSRSPPVSMSFMV